MKWMWGIIPLVAMVGVSALILCTKRPSTARADVDAPTIVADSAPAGVDANRPSVRPTQPKRSLPIPAPARSGASPSRGETANPKPVANSTLAFLPPPVLDVGLGPMHEVTAPPPAPKPDKALATVPPRDGASSADAAAGTGVELEWVGSTSVQVGQLTDFALLLRNHSSDRIHGAVVHVEVPAGVQVKATKPAATTDQGRLVWHFDTVLPGQVLHLHMSVLPTAHGALTPRASVSFTSSAASVLRLSAYEPKLVLRVTRPERVILGDSTNFTLHVNNPGDGPAENVVVHALLSPGLTHGSAQTVDFELGNLGAGETRDVQLVCTANAGGKQRCDVTATARAGVHAQDQATIQVLAPRLDLQVNGPTVRYVERRATYTMFITNEGDYPAFNVSAREVLPVGFNFLLATRGGRFDASTRTIAWFLGELSPGQTRELQFDVIAAHAGVCEHRMSACSERGGRIEVERRLTTRIEDISALLLEVSDSDDPIEIGKETVYEVVVTNAGSKTETDVKVVCTLPEQLGFRAAQGPARYQAQGNTVTFEPVAQLAPRGELVFKVTARALAAGQVHFQTRLTGAGLTEPIMRTEHTRIYADHP